MASGAKRAGGGVAPDVLVEPDTLTKAETALLRSGVANKFADDWVDKRPDVAKTLYARGLEPDADAASLVLQRSDLDSLKQRALKAIVDDPDAKQASDRAMALANIEAIAGVEDTWVALTIGLPRLPSYPPL